MDDILLHQRHKQTPPIEPARLDDYLHSHLIDSTILRRDDFEVFMADRQKRLLALIEQATGKAAYTGEAQEEGVEVQIDEDMLDVA